MRTSTPATFAAGVVATLVIGSGTALATTGGAFLLGHSNTVKATTVLTNTHGIPLALRAKGGRPAFSVNSKALIPNLDADLLDGQHASAFLPAAGQAADSAKLGGKDASAFLLANGKAADAAKLGGKDASSFLPANGQAADSAKLAGKDASAYLNSAYFAQADANGSKAASPGLETFFDTVTVPAGTYQVGLNVGLANPENDATEFVCAVAFKSDDVTKYGRYDYLDVVPFGTDALSDSTVDTFTDSTDISLLCSTSKGDVANAGFIAHSSLLATPLGAVYGTPTGY
ncbi:hypothetical protein acdb102_11070 [Acidothermaceae bacterium B102]|nr:hypothetical protein acdb102_11070 [Acidothermaceae bacterium B102]